MLSHLMRTPRCRDSNSHLEKRLTFPTSVLAPLSAPRSLDSRVLYSQAVCGAEVHTFGGQSIALLLVERSATKYLSRICQLRYFF